MASGTIQLSNYIKQKSRRTVESKQNEKTSLENWYNYLKSVCPALLWKMFNKLGSKFSGKNVWQEVETGKGRDSHKESKTVSVVLKYWSSRKQNKTKGQIP